MYEKIKILGESFAEMPWSTGRHYNGQEWPKNIFAS